MRLLTIFCGKEQVQVQQIARVLSARGAARCGAALHCLHLNSESAGVRDDIRRASINKNVFIVALIHAKVDII